MYSIISNARKVLLSNINRPVATLPGYFLKGLMIFFFLGGHIRLSKILRPMYSFGFLTPKISFIYLFKYLSFSIGTRSKLKILTNHYAYLQKRFPLHAIDQVFKSGVVCWKEVRQSQLFEIVLASTTPFENEGSLSLSFKMNGDTLYTRAFTFCPGDSFGLLDEQIIYVSRIQGAKGELDTITRSAKYFNDNTPPTLLISTLEGIAMSLGIKTLLGVSAHNQIGFCAATTNFQKCYDSFWKTFETTRISSGDYYLALPIRNKDISLIKSKYRGRTLNKRKVRQEISRKVYRYFVNNIVTSRKTGTLSVSFIQERARATA